MIKQLFRLLLILILISCSDDESSDMSLDSMTTTEPFCETKELEIKFTGISCDIENTNGICAVLTIEETQFIDQIAYDWTPDICGFELGDQITFKNGNNSTFWTVVDRSHYISTGGIYASCGTNWHDPALICQENEVVQVSFVSDILGIQDTLHLQLRTRIISYVDEEPGEKRNVVGLWQDKGLTNAAHFWINHNVGDEYYQQTWQSFNENVTLNGKEYKDVLKYEYGDHIHDEPHHRFYMEHGRGVLAFEVENRLWIRE
jgi:hypothetical protein